MKKMIAITAALLLTLALAFGCAPEAPAVAESVLAEELTATEGAAINNFVTRDLTGAEVDESIYEGHKLTMINIWATFCGPCKSEMPGLGELSHDYADEGVQIVGMISDVGDGYGNIDEEDMATVQEIIDSTAADYTHLLRSPDVDSVFLYSVYGVPTTIFVNEQGEQVGETIVGSQDKDGWAAMIDELLATLPA